MIVFNSNKSTFDSDRISEKIVMDINMRFQRFRLVDFSKPDLIKNMLLCHLRGLNKRLHLNNDDVLNERIDLFFYIIEYINDTLNISYIPDRLMVCAFLRINAESYHALLNDPRADIGLNLRNQIKNLEELIISMTMNGLEQGEINGYAWKKMQLKGEFGGNEIKQVETFNNNSRTVLITSGEDVKKRMESSYNFPELLEEKKDNKS